MTDEQSALIMKAKLSGEEVSFVGYTRENGQEFCVPVAGGGVVTIPRDAIKAWYGWKPDDPTFIWIPTKPGWQAFPNVHFFNSKQQTVSIRYE